MGTHRSARSAAAGLSRGATPDASTRSVLDSIRRIVRSLRVSGRSAEKRSGLSGAQLFVLGRLADGGRALSLNELARRTVTDQSSVSVVVQRLVKRGLVRTARSREDGRRVELELTAAGRRGTARSFDAAQDRLIGALGGMAAGERRRLASLLERLVREAGIADAAASLFFENDRDVAGSR
jgi:MarR family transcriptional regulator, lower aerobic nicotinate degradation pathway regulator